MSTFFSTTTQLQDDPHLSFRDINLSSLNPPLTILSGVTGYVVKGGITALMGASGSGKTLLMRALCGRAPGIDTTGTVSLNGNVIDPKKPNHMGFVPQEDILIGELTVRETFRISAQLRLSVSADQIESQIDELIKGLGLEHVADHVIGTVLKRGLSGGEKRRVSAGVELAARPAIIFLDEPTSGLDTSSAFVVMQSIKALAKNSGGRLSIIASVHQPNSRLLQLFDHLLILGRNGMLYFGTVSGSVDYFASLGFPCPSRTTPTDFFLHLTDRRFRVKQPSKPIKPVKTEPSQQLILVKPQPSPESTNSKRHSSAAIELQTMQTIPIQIQYTTTSEDSMLDDAYDYDFTIMYQLSEVAKAVRETITRAEASVVAWKDSADSPVYANSWYRQLSVLSRRNMMVASRDLTLYWLQFILNTFYGFMVGVEFWMLPKEIGTRLQDYPNGIVWLVFVGTYLHVFKIYYLMTMKERYHHEHANQSYATSAWSISDFLVTALWTFAMFIPGLMIAYFMMGFPSGAVGYSILVLFLVGMTAESLLDLLSQFTSYIPSAILVGQGSLVIWCVFAGGAFIRWQKIGFWIWLSQTSLYTWSTRGLMIRIFKEISYTCPTAFLITPETSNGTTSNECGFNGLIYPCDAHWDSTTSTCRIQGSTVLDVYKGVSSTNEWTEMGILLVILFSFRFLTYLLLRFPWSVIKHTISTKFRATTLNSIVLQHQQSLIQLASTIQVLVIQQQVQKSIQPPKQDVVEEQVVTIHEMRSNSKDKLTISSTPPIEPSRSFRWSSTPCSLTWQNLRLELIGSGKLLVDELYGYAQPGRILAIMGPSGAGKTTMLNALSGRAPYAKIMGQVQLGNQNLSKDHLDYVPQFDVLNPAMTVKQSFCMMSKLKNRDMIACDQRVGELLVILGLTTHGDKPIHELSSGDRKRVSIGLALISNPAVLFLDEPTTGLDSEAALVVVQYLIKVTRATGVICVMTIHQPSAEIFNQLDDLLLLTKGQTAYFGETSNATQYFTSIGYPVPNNTNPSDFYLDLVYAKTTQQIQALQQQRNDSDSYSTTVNVSAASVDDGDEVKETDEALPQWKHLYLVSPYATNLSELARRVSQSTTPTSTNRPSEWSRIQLLTKQKMVYYSREKAIYIYRMAQLILIAIFIGTLFYRQSTNVAGLNEIAGAMFFNVWVILFAAIGATPILVRDRFVFDNEYLNGAYHISSYCISVFLAAFPYHLITSIIYQTIVWYMVGFNDEGQAWVFAVLSTLALLLLMEGVSMIVVEFLPNAMLSTTFTMVVLGTFFLFPGFFIKVDDMVKSVAWISWIVPTKYSLDSQLYNIFHGQTYEIATPYGTMFILGDSIASNFFKLALRNKWGDWVIVMSYMIVFRVLHYVVLRWRFRKFATKSLAQMS